MTVELLFVEIFETVYFCFSYVFNSQKIGEKITYNYKKTYREDFRNFVHFLFIREILREKINNNIYEYINILRKELIVRYYQHILRIMY